MNKWLLLYASLFLLPHTAQALRCDRHVIKEGYHKSRVLHLCGEPDYIEHKTEYIDSNIGSKNRTNDTTIKNQTIIENESSLESDSSHVIPIHYEVWTYNFGRHRLVHHLTFRDGKLTKIEVDGYGYN